jgi:hypothetical protein
VTVVDVTIAPQAPLMQVTVAPSDGNPGGVALPQPQGCVLTVTLP